MSLSISQAGEPSGDSVPSGPRRGAPSGRKPRFETQDVLREALAMGLDRFTLSGIAERLGVVTSALYRLFPSRDMVIEKCLQEVVGRFRTPDPGMSWQGVLRLWGAELWNVVTISDGLAAVIVKYEYSADFLDGLWNSYTGKLLDSRKTRGQALFALRVIGDLVIGAATFSDGAPSRDVVGDSSDWRWQERHRTRIPVEELWTKAPNLKVKIELILEALASHWPESAA
jgi:hypothetical protein